MSEILRDPTFWQMISQISLWTLIASSVLAIISAVRHRTVSSPRVETRRELPPVKEPVKEREEEWSLFPGENHFEGYSEEYPPAPEKETPVEQQTPKQEPTQAEPELELGFSLGSVNRDGHFHQDKKEPAAKTAQTAKVHLPSGICIEVPVETARQIIESESKTGAKKTGGHS